MANIVHAMSLTPEEEQALLEEHVNGRTYKGLDPDSDAFPDIPDSEVYEDVE